MHALLWASFRLTRARLLFVVPIMLVGGWALLDVRADEPGGVETLVLLAVTVLSLLWPMSSRFLGERSGFPFAVDFVRPVHTWMLVGVPMAYLGAATAVLYAVPVLTFNAVFDVSLPLAPVAAWLVAVVVALAAAYWWTTSKSVRVLSWLALFLAGARALPRDFAYPPPRERWPELFAFELADYVPVALVVAAAFAVAVFGVGRQRRGEDWWGVLAGRFGSLGAVGSGLNELLAVHRNGWGVLFRAPCPSASPVRAELWLEMKYRGIPVLAIGALLAVVAIPLMFWIAQAAVLIPVIAAGGTLVIPPSVGVNASMWGRRKAGSGALSAFEATRAAGTARLVGLQVLVTIACTLGAWLLIGGSILASLPLLNDVDGFEAVRRGLLAALGTVPAHRLVADAALAVVALSTVIALLLAFRALAQKHGMRLYLGLLALTVYLMLLAFATASGWIGVAVFEAHAWLAAVAVPLAGLYAFHRVLREKILGARHAAAAGLLWLGFAALYLDSLRDSGILVAELSAVLAAPLLGSFLLPLAAVALVPWSFGLIRHS